MIMALTKGVVALSPPYEKHSSSFKSVHACFCFYLLKKFSKPSLQKTHAYLFTKYKIKSLQNNDNQKKTLQNICQKFEKTVQKYV